MSIRWILLYSEKKNFSCVNWQKGYGFPFSKAMIRWWKTQHVKWKYYFEQLRACVYKTRKCWKHSWFWALLLWVFRSFVVFFLFGFLLLVVAERNKCIGSDKFLIVFLSPLWFLIFLQFVYFCLVFTFTYLLQSWIKFIQKCSFPTMTRNQIYATLILMLTSSLTCWHFYSPNDCV